MIQNNTNSIKADCVSAGKVTPECRVPDYGKRLCVSTVRLDVCLSVTAVK